MADYKVVARQYHYYLADLITALQAIQTAHEAQGNIYVLDDKDEYLNILEEVELTCSDGRVVHDVRLRTSKR